MESPDDAGKITGLPPPGSEEENRKEKKKGRVSGLLSG